MENLSKLSVLTALLLLAACSSESERGLSGDPSAPSEMEGAARREVLMTLKNKLQVAPASKGIATEAENKIRTLDVYVFGSEAEDGEYTFQERVAYREDGSPIPVGAVSLDLTAKGTEGTETTALLSLKKGLFVKLYCVANQSQLTSSDGRTIQETDFVPLELTAPGQPGTSIKTPGQPKLDDFLKYSSVLMNAGAAADTLVVPLPMSGAYTTPLDLTDFAVSSRTQVGFKLARMVARFDVTNNAAESKFTLESISMANGRRGAGFFPVKVYDAGADKLITYPTRNFWGDKANTGTQTGAFYTWPSLPEDNAYLIMKGKYQVNQTEAKEVTYQVPFKQSTADGAGSFLEISHNHRYTIGITKADEYHLDVNLTVSDWADDGSIDDYTPEDGDETKGEVTIPAGDLNSEYDPLTKTVTLSLNADSYFDIKIQSSAVLVLNKTYVGGPDYQQYDWLEVTTTPDIQTKAGVVTEYACNVALKKNYTGGRYPRTILRFQNTVDGTENVFFVEPLSAPLLVDAVFGGTGNYNTYDKGTSVVNMYRTNECDVQLKMVCVEEPVVEAPDWLNVKKIAETGPERTYQLTLKNADEVVANDEGTLTFKNPKFTQLVTDLTVKLLATDITASDMTITAANSGTTNLPVTSPQGCTASVPDATWNGGGQWFDLSGSSISGGLSSVAINQRDNQSTIMKPVTVRLTNKIKGGKDKDVLLTPILDVPSLNGTSGTINALAFHDVVIQEYKTKTFTFTKPAGNVGTITSSDPSIVTVSVSGTTVTMTALKKGTTTIKVPNGSDGTKVSTYTVTVAQTTVNDGGGAPYYSGGLLVQKWEYWANINWYDAQTKCPSGWRLPTSAEATRFWTYALTQQMISDGYLQKPSVGWMNWWTSSTGQTSDVGVVFFIGIDGGVGQNDYTYKKNEATSLLAVRCVRTP